MEKFSFSLLALFLKFSIIFYIVLVLFRLLFVCKGWTGLKYLSDTNPEVFGLVGVVSILRLVESGWAV